MTHRPHQTVANCAAVSYVRKITSYMKVIQTYPCDFAILQGAAVYAPEKEAMVWKIKNFPGGKEFLLRCKFGLPSVEAEEEAKGRMPPIRVKFEIPYFTVSGIQVGQFS